MGYAGGTTPNPTYYAIGDHSEAIQVDYDPERISFEELVAIFWDSHSCTVQSYSTQYQNILFYSSPQEEQIALASRDLQADALNGRVLTRIEPVSAFYRAEDYHQKYYLRSDAALKAYYLGIYPDPQDLTDSTATARINGYLSGAGTREQLLAEAAELGLSQPMLDHLLALMGRRR